MNVEDIERSELIVKINKVSHGYDQSLWQNIGNRLSNSKPSRRMVLENCSLNVPKGKIYSLLGSSGCGKTTTLKCILGIIKPSEGSVDVFIDKNKTLSKITGSNVGYMPQELALMEEITIEETLKFFGQLHEMSMNAINERMRFLLKFLNIKDKSRIIRTLSGGQQRRVSIAVAMLHNPMLLILDEPTVGVDPVLRHAIWQYLETLCRTDNITVMITTHYIEEARNSHNIGMMRGGKLIAEGNPEKIMEQYSCDTMEDVFLIISIIKPNLPKFIIDKAPENEEITDDNDATDLFGDYNELGNVETFKEKGKWNHFSHIQALLYKNWLVTRRNPKSLLFLYLLPSIQISLFVLTLGREPNDIPIAVYNPESKTSLSGALLSYINDSEMIKQTRYETLISGIESVVSAKAYALITMPNNYSQAFHTRISENIDASDTTVEYSNIHLYLDTSNFVLTVSVIQTVLKSLIRLMENYFPEISYIALQSLVPIDIMELVYGGDSSGRMTMDLTLFMAPGMLMCAIFIAPFPFVLFVITKEKKIKFLARSIISGAKSYEILISILLIQLFILFTQVLVLMFTAFYLWDIENNGSVVLVFCLLYFQGFVGILLAVIITSLSPNEGAAFMIAFATVLPLWLSSGVIWPTESLSKVAYHLVHLTPLTYPIDGLRSIMSRGWSLDSPTVLFCLSFNATYIAVFFIFAVIIYKYFITADS